MKKHIIRVWRRFRSAITGRFVSPDEASANPDTTVCEARPLHDGQAPRNR